MYLRETETSIMITGVLRFPHSHSLPGLLLLGSVNRNQLTCSFVLAFCSILAIAGMCGCTSLIRLVN